MSLAKDDVGISGALNALKAEFIKSRTLEENIDTTKNSGSKKPEINDVFEKESSKNIDAEKKKLTQLQEEYNSVKLKKQALEKTDDVLAQMEESGEIPDEEKLKELEKAIEGISAAEEEPEQQNSNAETRQDASDRPAQTDSQNISSPEKENNNDSARKVAELRAKVNEKQQQLAQLEQKLYHEVSSTIELKIGKTKEPDESLRRQAEELKGSVVDSINEEPEKAPKIHITNLDKNLILAMLSLAK